MADTKITALAAITVVDPAADVLPIVDISDTSMAASGTTKKITSNQILGSGGTATLASATITGALTVDTTTLVVDATNNRVGVGTATPDATLDVTSAGTASTYTVSAVIQDGTYPASGNPTLELNGFIGGNDYRSGIGSIGGQQLAFYTPTTYGVAPTRRMVVDSSGNLALDNGNVVMTTSGKGIDFSATTSGSGTMTSELLNDYEEGTFTPNIGGTATYTSQNGRYVKIGNRVYVTLRLAILLRGTGSTSAISGIPFAIGASSPICSVSIGYFADLAISINYISAYANSSSITLTGTTSATTSVTNGVAVIGNGTDIAMSFFYEV